MSHSPEQSPTESRAQETFIKLIEEWGGKPVWDYLLTMRDTADEYLKEDPARTGQYYDVYPQLDEERPKIGIIAFSDGRVDFTEGGEGYSLLDDAFRELVKARSIEAPDQPDQ